QQRHVACIRRRRSQRPRNPIGNHHENRWPSRRGTADETELQVIHPEPPTAGASECHCSRERLLWQAAIMAMAPPTGFATNNFERKKLLICPRLGFSASFQ